MRTNTLQYPCQHAKTTLNNMESNRIQFIEFFAITRRGVRYVRFPDADSLYASHWMLKIRSENEMQIRVQIVSILHISWAGNPGLQGYCPSADHRSSARSMCKTLINRKISDMPKILGTNAESQSTPGIGP